MQRRIRSRHVTWFAWRYVVDHRVHAFSRAAVFLALLVGTLFAGHRAASLYSGRVLETVLLIATAGLCGIWTGGYALSVLRRMRGESTGRWDILSGLTRPLALAAFGVIISFRFGYADAYPGPEFSAWVSVSALYLPLVLFVLLLLDRKSGMISAVRETFEAMFSSPASVGSMSLIFVSGLAVWLVSITFGLVRFGAIGVVIFHWLALPMLVGMICGAYLSYFGRRKRVGHVPTANRSVDEPHHIPQAG